MRVGISCIIIALLSAAPAAQQAPPAKKPARVQIRQGPALEIAYADIAIVRWTTNNPGGTDDRFAVIHYGTSPNELTMTARSHIRLNRGHDTTVFRVRVSGLMPQTTYYYRVDSTESNGTSDALRSPLKQFRTPGPGERFPSLPATPRS